MKSDLITYDKVIPNATSGTIAYLPSILTTLLAMLNLGSVGCPRDSIPITSLEHPVIVRVWDQYGSNNDLLPPLPLSAHSLGWG